MKYLILLTLFACSSHKTPEATKTEVSTATESEAKPASPLTVEPCFCMKIYQPVCVDGVQYGNSCEAECHGNKKWVDGNCPTPKKK
jgi:hypothetical protein